MHQTALDESGSAAGDAQPLYRTRFPSQMNDYRLDLDESGFDRLIEFAKLAHQSHNIGNNGNWFGHFVDGVHGAYSRLHGCAKHYYAIHAWTYELREPMHIEYHLSTLLFNMDSAIECITFALNALGYAADAGSFRSLTDEKTLRRIAPVDILGDPAKNPPLQPLDGYAQVFPAVQSLWQANEAIIRQIQDLHDVSKHRGLVLEGGQLRNDPPAGFDQRKIRGLPPPAELILRPDPKQLAEKRNKGPLQPHDYLETMAPKFVDLVNGTGHAAHSDWTRRMEVLRRSIRPASTSTEDERAV